MYGTLINVVQILGFIYKFAAYKIIAVYFDKSDSGFL